MRGQIDDYAGGLDAGWCVRSLVIGHAEAVVLILSQARARELAEAEVRRQKGAAGAGLPVFRELWVRDGLPASTDLVRDGGQRANVEANVTAWRVVGQSAPVENWTV